MKCNCCLKEKEVSEFLKRPKNKRGYDYYCRKCNNDKQRKRRLNNDNIITKKYEKTIKGKLVRTYRNMKSRVGGVLKNKNHLYKGLSILDKEDFYEWSLNNDDYKYIFKKWKESGYDLKKSPSIDRIDADKGYEKGNIRWVTFSENCSSARR